MKEAGLEAAAGKREGGKRATVTGSARNQQASRAKPSQKTYKPFDYMTGQTGPDLRANGGSRTGPESPHLGGPIKLNWAERTSLDSPNVTKRSQPYGRLAHLVTHRRRDLGVYHVSDGGGRTSAETYPLKGAQVANGELV
jgi:hypothetical protein